MPLRPEEPPRYGDVVIGDNGDIDITRFVKSFEVFRRIQTDTNCRASHEDDTSGIDFDGVRELGLPFYVEFPIATEEERNAIEEVFRDKFPRRQLSQSVKT